MRRVSSASNICSGGPKPPNIAAIDYGTEAFGTAMQAYRTQLVHWEERMNEINQQAEEERSYELELPQVQSSWSSRCCSARFSPPP